MSLRALVVFNPVAPRADPEKLREALDQAFATDGGQYRVFETFPSDDLSQQLGRAIADAVDEGCDLVIAAGGDGTVSLVADSLALRSRGPATHVAIVPLGTANILARELGVPIDIEQAVNNAAERARVVTLDAIQFGERRFLTQVGVGLDALMIEATTREAQIKLGRLAYLLNLLQRAVGYRSHRFVLDVDGQTHKLRAWQVVVANAATIGAPPFTWGPGIDPSDGVLDVCVYNARTPKDYIAVAWRILTGRHRRDDRVRYLRVREKITIRSERPMPVQGDGDLIGDTPITLGIAPQAINLVTPVEPSEKPPDGPIQTEDPPASATSLEAAVDRTPQAHGGLLQRLAAVDAKIFFRINRLPQWGPFDWLMATGSRLMNYGEAWVFVALVTALVDARFGPRFAIVVVSALWLTMLTVNYPIKALFGRRRPFVVHVETRVVGRRPLDSSFPSGHTAAAFAGAALLAPHLPALAPAFYLYAALVGFSRVYLGIHYPSDVAIGALLGTALGIGYAALIRALTAGLGW